MSIDPILLSNLCYNSSNQFLKVKILVDLYAEKKLELEGIISEAKKESDLWGEIINTFNCRFFVPFKVSLINKEDVILKKQTANLEFSYADRGEEPIEQDKNSQSPN